MSKDTWFVKVHNSDCPFLAVYQDTVNEDYIKVCKVQRQELRKKAKKLDITGFPLTDIYCLQETCPRRNLT